MSISIKVFTIFSVPKHGNNKMYSCFKNILMKALPLTAILFLLMSCNGQSKSETETKKENITTTITGKNSAYNVFQEGEMKRDFAALINKNKQKIETALASTNYKKPSAEVFREKLIYFFNWDVKDYSNIITMQADLLPEIAVKDLGIVFIEGDIDEIDAHLLYHYNQFIFADDKASLTWLKAKQPELLVRLVKNYGFTKNDDVLQFVFQKVNFKNSFDISEIIFGSVEDKFVLRNEMLNKIREIHYKNAVANGFSETVSGDFYYTLDKVISDIVQNKNAYKNADESTAVLLNELALSGMTGSIDYFLNGNPSYLDTLQKEQFFQQGKLKEYVENMYGAAENEVSDIYFIRDADGYTNLRKEKNTASAILEKIPSDQQINILNNEGDWWQVQTQSGKKGFVHQSKIGVR